MKSAAPFAVVLATASLFWASSSRAQTPEDPLGSYTRHERSESPQNYAFELRMGPYRPQIDEDFSGVKPYEQVFGTKQRWFIGAELDWQAFRIPGLGTVGPGFGIGYTHMSANARLTSNGAASAESTSLAILPMYAVGVLRADVLARETAVPLVGYVKAGLGYGLWWTGTDVGTSKVNGVVGRGSTAGTQLAAGGMLLLDSIDPHAAVELDNEWGINNTYAYFEWMMSNLDGLQSSSQPHSSMHIGTSTWVIGLAFEM